MKIANGIVVATLLVAGAAGAQTFPADGQWMTVTKNGAPLIDPPNDIANGQPTRDVVGTAALPAAFAWSDATYLYFRLRVDSSPGGGTNFDPRGWLCQVNTDTSPTRYDLSVVLAGKNPETGDAAGDNVRLYRNTAGTNSPGDTADTPAVKSYTSATSPTFNALTDVATAAGSAGDEGTTDFFVSWAIPWSDLAGLGVTSTSPLRIVCGTNSDGTSVLTNGNSADIVNEIAASWSDLASDPFTCGPSGCSTCNREDACGLSCTACQNPTPICQDDDDGVFDATCVPCDGTPPCPNGGACNAGICVECENDDDCEDPTAPVCDDGECVPCRNDMDCGEPTPHCLATGACGDCRDDADCGGTTPVCNAEHVCVGCGSDADCAEPTPACLSTGACGECLDGVLHCSDTPGTPFCVGATPPGGSGTCEQCRDDDDCGGTTPVCNGQHVCVGCATDADCSEPTPACLGTGACGECLDDALHCSDTPGTPFCVGEVVPSTSGTCEQCRDDDDCGGTTPVCDDSHTCVGCRGDDDCPASAPACLGTGACGECLGDQHCNTDAPHCVGSDPPDVPGTCEMCASDADCAGLTPICDDITHVCVMCGGDPECMSKDPAHPACQGNGSCNECTDSNTTICPLNASQCSDEGLCVPCDDDGDCAGTPTTPICRGNVCSPCQLDTECPSNEPACQPSGACGDCNATNQKKCTDRGDVCDVPRGVCEDCVVNADCKVASLPFCDVVADPNRCVAGCDEDGDCPPPRPVCNLGGPRMGLCTECTVEKDEKCAGTSEPICNPDDGTCVECVTTADCPEGVCDPTTHRCVPCLSPADCPVTAPFCSDHLCVEDCPNDAACPPPTPVCNFTGPRSGECTECAPRDTHLCLGDEPVCDPEEGTCVECLEASDCHDPARPVCAAGQCVGCDGDSQCGGTTPACQPDGTCGQCSATNDVMCAPPTPVCDPASGMCVALDQPDAGVPDAAPPPPPDAAPPPPDAAPPPPDAAVATPDAAGSADGRVVAPPPDAAVSQPITPLEGVVEGGGCACRVTGERRAPEGPAFFLLLGAAALLVRRRRR